MQPQRQNDVIKGILLERQNQKIDRTVSGRICWVLWQLVEFEIALTEQLLNLIEIYLTVLTPDAKSVLTRQTKQPCVFNGKK